MSPIDRKTVFLVAAALAALGAWPLLRGTPPRASAATVVQEDSSRSNGSRITEATEIHTERRRPVPSAAAQVSEKDELVAEVERARRILGADVRFTLARADGTLDHEPNLSMSVMFHGRSGGFGRDREVRDGRLAVDVADLGDGRYARAVGRPSLMEGTPDEIEIVLSRPEVEGDRPVWFESSSGGDCGLHRAVAPFGSVGATVRLREAQDVTLHVVDAETDRPLDHVDVLIHLGGWMASAEQPGASRTEPRATNASSPVVFAPGGSRFRIRNTNYLVGADGFAWKRVCVDLVDGRDRHVALERGGSLDVELIGSIPRGAKFRLYRSDPYHCVAEFGHRDEIPSRFDGLLPSRYDARVEFGEAFGKTRVVGEGTVQVHAGSRPKLTVDIGATPKFETGSVRGTIVLPPAWEIAAPSGKLTYEGGDAGPRAHARVVGTSRWTPVAGSAGEYTVEVDRLQVGPWRFQVNGIHSGRNLVVEAGATTEFRVEIPPPVELRVRPVVESSGACADLEALFWQSVDADGERTGPSGRSSAADDDNWMTLRVPRGRVRLSTGRSEYHAPDRIVDARADHTMDLPVRRSATVFVRVTCEGQRIPLVSTTGWRANEIGRSGTLIRRSFTDDGWECQVSNPGTYRLVLPAIPGFAPTEPIEFEAVEGETNLVDVELERAR